MTRLISYRISPFVIYEAIRSYMCVFEDKKHHGKKKDQASQTVPVEGQKGGKRELLNEAAGGEPSKKKKKKKKRKVSFTSNVVKHLSHLMGKPTICIGENKGADQLRSNCEADQRLCFRYSDTTIPPLLNSKISSF